ncbi:MAG: hypothetical protein RJA76_1692, partial [Bacteroidota bacterium]
MLIKNKKNLLYFGLLIAVLFLGTYLRMYHLDQFSIAGDEFYTVLSSNYVSQEGGLQNFLNQTSFTNKDWKPSNDLQDLFFSMARRDNGSGFLYLFLLHYWIKLVGFEDWGLRLFSVLINIVLVTGVFFFCKNHLKSKITGLLATSFACISPFLISYSQVARTYSLVFLMALICSHYFLITLRSEKNNQWKPFIWYGIFAFLTLMSHYSSFVILIFQAGFLLIFSWKNLLSHFLKYLVAALIPIIGMAIWLNSPGGSYSFNAIEVSKIYYNQVASAGGNEWLHLISIKSVGTQLLKVFAMSNIFFDQLGMEALGKRNFILTGLIAGVSILLRQQNQIKLKVGLLIALDLICFIVLFNFVTNHGINFIILYLLIILTFSHFKEIIPQSIQEKYILGIYLFSFISLVLFGLMDGNTFRIIPRYAGFGYVFGIIFSCIFIIKIWQRQQTNSNYLIAFLCLFTAISTKSLISDIYNDKMEPYFYSWPKARSKNQYIIASKKIDKMYMKGDTVIYPSFVYKNSKFEVGMPHHSVQVAQYMNLYLNQSPKEIYQKIDTTN